MVSNTLVTAPQPVWPSLGPVLAPPLQQFVCRDVKRCCSLVGCTTRLIGQLPDMVECAAFKPRHQCGCTNTQTNLQVIPHVCRSRWCNRGIFFAFVVTAMAHMCVLSHYVPDRLILRVHVCLCVYTVCCCRPRPLTPASPAQHAG
jgi:hypothetical protein